MITESAVRVPGMDGLLGLLVAILVFAGIIFFAGRSTRYIIVLGLGLLAVAALVYFGVVP